MGHSNSVFVVVPLFNKASYVGAAISSLLAQSFPTWNAVIVDDGSTDGSFEVAIKFAGSDARIQIVQQPNGGVAKARKLGLHFLPPDCKFVLFLDADDALIERSFEILTTLLAKEENAIGAVGGVRFIDEHGADISDSNKEKLNPVGSNEKSFFENDDFCVHNPIASPGQVLLRRAKLQIPDLFQDGIDGVEDMDLWYRLTASGDRFIRSPQTTFLYRVLAGSLSKNVRKMRTSALEMHRRWYRNASSSIQRQKVIDGYTRHARAAIPRIRRQLLESLTSVHPRLVLSNTSRLIIAIVRSNKTFTEFLLLTRWFEESK